MKQLLLLILMTIPTLAFAHVGVNFDHSNFFKATSISYEPLCPIDKGLVCVVDGTIINLTYNVKCSETMASFEYQVFEGPNGELDIVVAAKKNNVNEKYECLAFATVNKQITLLNHHSTNIPIHELGSKKFEGLNLDEISFYYPQ